MKYPAVLFLMILLSMCHFDDVKSIELGLVRQKNGYQLNVWSSSADEIEVKIYKDAQGGPSSLSIKMKHVGDGYWQAVIDEKWKDYFYTISAHINGQWQEEVVDPYAKLVGVNGIRAFIGDPTDANPEGWNEDQYVDVGPREAIIYEMQIRDFSVDPIGMFKHPGKYLAFTEKNKSLGSQPIGMDHIIELGVTHVHLLPTFDFASIDESDTLSKYNWGYEPLNYNVPEGSFCSDPFDPLTRVGEFKQMVMAFHEAGIGVIMDVVYNHTGPSEKSNFHQLEPNYYHRMDGDRFSNASACGNETASERPMMRRFMIESMIYWMKEYHVDGFRVDLMGIHDIETMNMAKEELQKINPNVLFYGEGWTAGSSPLPEERRAIKKNASQLNDIAVFSDEMRDGLKGHWNAQEDRGFVTGKSGTRESVKFGIVGAIEHSQVDIQSVNYTDHFWAKNPLQMVSYVTCHDGMTLIDRLIRSYPDIKERQYKAMHKLANTVVMTSQGIPFLHAGVEIMRTKQGVDNSFESPDSINAIDWSLKVKNDDVFKYYQSLIRMRKNHPAFKMTTGSAINQNLRFYDQNDELLLIFQIDGAACGDSWSQILVIFNGNLEKREVNLPEGEWDYEINNGEFVSGNLTASGAIDLAPSSATILYRLTE
jgi:pullulanase